jgi:ABC-2 type transport system permease protein
MRAMMKCDFICIKSALRETTLSSVFVAVIIFISTQEVYVVVPCVCASIAIGLFFSLLSLDEQNGWQRFRLALPFSRKDVIFGRYLSCLIDDGMAMAVSYLLGLLCIGGAALLKDAGIDVLSEEAPVLADSLELFISALAGAAITILMMAFVLPFVAKMGLTKATRLFPMVFVLLTMLFLYVARQAGALDPGFEAWMQDEMHIT